MIGFIKFLQKRPTDKTILFWRIMFWLIYISIMYYNLIILPKWIDSSYLFWLVELSIEQVNILKYIMISIWIVPIIMWAWNICMLKKKYIKIIQIVFWFLLFYIAWSIEDSANLDFDVIIWFMWIFPLLAWITGKCITTKCLKYKEKITKIRV